MGFNIGADDYISKPFSIREVIARVKAVLRRIVDKEDPAILQFEKLYIDSVKKRAFIDSTELPLTKKNLKYYPSCFPTRDKFSLVKKYYRKYGQTRYMF